MKNDMKSKSKKKIVLAVSHDAGGAEVVSAYLKSRIKNIQPVCLVAGPAEKVYAKRGLNSFFVSLEKRNQIFEMYPDIDLVLTSTSWPSKLELEMIELAKKANIKTATYLDSWVNYRERFDYPNKGWENNLPEEIWVGDLAAKKLAHSLFPKEVKIKFVKNCFFEEFKKSYRDAKKTVKNISAILFASQPLAIMPEGEKDRGTIDEFTVLKDLLNELKEINFKNRVIIRLHPREEKGKYNALIDVFKQSLDVVESLESDILKDLSKAKLVVGMNSMFLFLATLIGKKVISILPVGELNFPRTKIIQLKKAKGLGKYIN